MGPRGRTRGREELREQTKGTNQSTKKMFVSGAVLSFKVSMDINDRLIRLCIGMMIWIRVF